MWYAGAAVPLLRGPLSYKQAAGAPARVLGLARFLGHMEETPVPTLCSQGTQDSYRPWGAPSRWPFQGCLSLLCGLGKAAAPL